MFNRLRSGIQNGGFIAWGGTGHQQHETETDVSYTFLSHSVLLQHVRRSSAYYAHRTPGTSAAALGSLASRVHHAALILRRIGSSPCASLPVGPATVQCAHTQLFLIGCCQMMAIVDRFFRMTKPWARCQSSAELGGRGRNSIIYTVPEGEPGVESRLPPSLKTDGVLKYKVIPPKKIIS